MIPYYMYLFLDNSAIIRLTIKIVIDEMFWTIRYKIYSYVIGDNATVKCKYNLHFTYYYISETSSINARWKQRMAFTVITENKDMLLKFYSIFP